MEVFKKFFAALLFLELVDDVFPPIPLLLHN